MTKMTHRADLDGAGLHRGDGHIERDHRERGAADDGRALLALNRLGRGAPVELQLREIQVGDVLHAGAHEQLLFDHDGFAGVDPANRFGRHQ